MSVNTNENSLSLNHKSNNSRIRKDEEKEESGGGFFACLNLTIESAVLTVTKNTDQMISLAFYYLLLVMFNVFVFHLDKLFYNIVIFILFSTG